MVPSYSIEAPLIDRMQSYTSRVWNLFRRVNSQRTPKSSGASDFPCQYVGGALQGSRSQSSAVQDAMLQLTAERDAALAETDRLSRQLESQQAQLQSLQSQLSTEHNTGAQSPTLGHVVMASEGLGLGASQGLAQGFLTGSEASPEEAAAEEEREAAVGKLQAELAEARVQLGAVTARLADAIAAAGNPQRAAEEALSAKEAELKVSHCCMMSVATLEPSRI